MNHPYTREREREGGRSESVSVSSLFQTFVNTDKTVLTEKESERGRGRKMRKQ